MSTTHLPWAQLDASIDDCYGSVAIDGVSMHTSAWNLPDLSELWATPEQRGSNRLLPHVTGVKAYKRRATESRVSLPLHVVGAYNVSGNAASTLAQAFEYFEANMTYLQTYVLLPTNVGDGTRSLTWTLPSGRTISVDVHVLPFRPALLPGAQAKGTLELAVPNGDLHL